MIKEISSRVPQEPTLTDVVVKEAHPEFGMTGLKVSSVIRLDKVATIWKDLILGEIGDKLKKEINSGFVRHMDFTLRKHRDKVNEGWLCGQIASRF